MKTRILLPALAIAAAFAACTKENVPAEAPAFREVTLRVEAAAPAGTRASYTENGDVYQFAWSEDDILYVIYADDNAEYGSAMVEFSINEIVSAKKATFSGTIPADVTDVLVVYSSEPVVPLYEYYDANFTGGAITPTNTLAKRLEANTFLSARTTVDSDGNLSDVKLQHGLAYLLLKEGLRLMENNTEYDLSGFCIWVDANDVTFDLDGFQGTDGSDLNMFLSTTFDEDGYLTRDFLVPIYVGTEIERSLDFMVTCDEIWGMVDQPSHVYQGGVIYEVAANNTNWKPIVMTTWDEEEVYDDEEGHP